MMERQTHAKHARLPLPGLDHLPAFGLIDWNAAHHGETLRVFLCGLQRVIHPVAFPRGRNKNGPIDPGFRH